MSNHKSLLLAFSKVFKKVLYVRMYQHLINDNILADEHFGFSTKSSTMTATFDLVNEIINAFN
jgi:CRISPR/Cas system-associated endonuclease Cas1